MKQVRSLIALVLIPSAVFATVVISETIEEKARPLTVAVRGQIVQAQTQLDRGHRGAAIGEVAQAACSGVRVGIPG